jgi:hypothetical protein
VTLICPPETRLAGSVTYTVPIAPIALLIWRVPSLRIE